MRSKTKSKLKNKKHSPKKVNHASQLINTDSFLGIGWPIFGILIAIAALAYFGVLNFDNLLPDYCKFTQGITCSDAVFSGSHRITIVLKNTLEADMNNINLAMTSMDGCTVNGTGVPSMATNAQASYSFDVSNCNFFKGERVKSTMALNYVSSQSTLQHSRSGEMMLRVP
jgi:hypothetical protein